MSSLIRDLIFITRIRRCTQLVIESARVKVRFLSNRCTTLDVYRFRKRILVRVSTIRCIHIGVGEEEEKEERQTPLDLIYSENAFGMHSRTVLET